MVFLWGEGAFANCKVWDLHQVEGKLNQSRLSQHPAISSRTRLVVLGFVLM